MKKHLIMAPLLALAATGAFALDVVAGLALGFSNGGTYYGEFIDDDGKQGENEYKGHFDVKGASDFGFFGSLGWKYLDINVGFFFNTTTTKIDYGWTKLEHTFSSTRIQLGLYFKVPITFSSRFRLFPTAGADVNFETVDYINLFVGGGLGADIMLFKNMFLRAAILGGGNIFWEGGGALIFRVGAGWLL